MCKIVQGCFSSQNSQQKEETEQSYGYKHGKLSYNSNCDMKKVWYQHRNQNPQSHPCPYADDNVACNKYLREYKEWEFLVEIY